MLKFIGTGSAFNTKLGNNSAYYKKDGEMLLIDCGSNVFQRIKENDLLHDVNLINVVITHCHADHVGSLADLILYTYYSHGEFAKLKVKVISAFDTEVEELLKINGCVEGVHFELELVDGEDDDVYTLNSMDISYRLFKSSHVEEIPSYSIGFLSEENTVYYSSDANIESYKDMDFMLSHDFIYIDTCKADYKGNVHLSLRELTELIEPQYRSRVWCMHLDEGFIKEEAIALGFNVAETISREVDKLT